MNNTVWLASYPKSGNTWLRLILQYLLNDANDAVDINKLTLGSPIASCRNTFDDVVGLESGLLSRKLIADLRPEVYSQLAQQSDTLRFCKIHDAYTISETGKPLVPKDATKAVIYLIRNPLDIAVSWAHFIATDDLDRVIRQMNDEECLGFDGRFRQAEQLPQRMLSWHRHVQSWLDAPLPVMVVRYEDLYQSPVQTFYEIIQFLNLEYSKEKVKTAVENNRFERLQGQEQLEGFKEKPAEAKLFFRKGQVGSWRETLTLAQCHQLIADHASVMQRFGYLTAKGDPLY